jgi:hypothetical protein
VKTKAKFRDAPTVNMMKLAQNPVPVAILTRTAVFLYGLNFTGPDQQSQKKNEVDPKVRTDLMVV